MTIGERIKELRKKNDLTQEKMADYLCVSYQAVSKWECGLSSPDLTMIRPLTKLLNVSADELLGLTDAAADTRLEELEKAYKDTLHTGDLDIRIKISAEAVKEYPGNMKWLNRYAQDFWCVTVTVPEENIFVEQRDKVIKMFQTVIENAGDDIQTKSSAIGGIVHCLCGKGCRAEAKKYAELFPEPQALGFEKDELMANCLETEEERLEQKQKIFHRHFYEIIRRLTWPSHNSDTSRNAAETIIKTVIPDGNYLEHHYAMYRIKLLNAKQSVGEEDKCISLQKEALLHAKEYNKIGLEEKGEYRYTAPLLDHYKIDTREWCWADNSGTFLDDFKENLNEPVFDSLRHREDFKQLII